MIMVEFIQVKCRWNSIDREQDSSEKDFVIESMQLKCLRTENNTSLMLALMQAVCLGITKDHVRHGGVLAGLSSSGFQQDYKKREKNKQTNGRRICNTCVCAKQPSA
jgi:hypothetical protein